MQAKYLSIHCVAQIRILVFSWILLLRSLFTTGHFLFCYISFTPK